MDTNKPASLKEIAARFAAEVKAQLGFSSEVTFIGSDRFSVLVEPANRLERVKSYLRGIDTVHFEDQAVCLDDGDDYALAYYRY
jgi:hypothetical protein